MAVNFFPNTDTGKLCIEGRGLFAYDTEGPAALGRRELPFYPQRKTTSFANRILRFADDTDFVLFEIRPKEKLCLIGENIWAGMLESGLVSDAYDDAIRNAPAVKYHRVTGRVAVVTLLLSPFYFGEPVSERWPIRVGISLSLNKDVCVVGSELLNYGMLLWDANMTGLVWNHSSGIEVAGLDFRTPSPSIIET